MQSFKFTVEVEGRVYTLNKNEGMGAVEVSRLIPGSPLGVTTIPQSLLDEYARAWALERLAGAKL
jgi:hypothetical protein